MKSPLGVGVTRGWVPKLLKTANVMAFYATRVEAIEVVHASTSV
jgi:hypothetical protein